MATAAKHFAEVTLPFGDAETVFRMDYKHAAGWERENDRSLMAAFDAMVRTRTGSLGDVSAILHMGLVGAGMTPSKATVKIERWVEQRPLAENLPTAMAVLEAFLLGNDEYQGGE